MKLRILGLEVEFQTQGQGSDILLLHGWGGNQKYWGQLVPEMLRCNFRVTTVDLPGFGESSLPPKEWGLHDYARLVQMIIKELNLKKPSIIGHSLGGAIGIALVVQQPKLLEKLILVSSSGIRQASFKKFMGLALAKSGKTLLFPFPDSWQKKFRRAMYKGLNETDYLESGQMKETFINIIKYNLSPILPRITVPTLLIWGDQDKDTPVKMGQAMNRLIPNSQLVVLKGVGHFPFIDRPKEICELVIEFLRNE